ncbi:hypothetical protein BDR07DRAFT_1403645 [Suillus spraguei]|nr:hypothetical protein BDR07DRAFT_1403645 [Suillus spraguei]
MNRHEQDLMMRRARKQFLPEILKKRSASMLSLLDATVMNAFNLSSAVSLFGSTEEQDIKRYNEAYDSFYQTLLEVMERRIDNEMLPNCKADDSEYKILKNWVEKIKWLHAGFNPHTHELQPELRESTGDNTDVGVED